MQRKPNYKYQLKTDQLEKSENKAIQALCEDSFLIIPPNFASPDFMPVLSADTNRSLEIRVGNQLIDSKTIMDEIEAKAKAKAEVEVEAKDGREADVGSTFDSQFATKVAQSGRDAQMLRKRLNDAYSQQALYYLRFTLDQALKQSMESEVIDGDSPLSALKDLPTQPYSYAGRITIPVNQKKTDNVKLEIAARGFPIRSGGKADVLLIKGTYSLNAELVEVEPKDIKQIMRRKALENLATYQASDAYNRALINDPESAARQVAKFESKITAVETTTYPTHLFRVTSIKTDSLALRDVVQQKKLPDLTQKKYQKEIEYPGLAGQKRSYYLQNERDLKERIDSGVQAKTQAWQEIEESANRMAASANEARPAFKALLKKQNPPAKDGSIVKSCLWALAAAVSAMGTAALTFLAVASGGLLIPAAAAAGVVTASCGRNAVSEYRAFTATNRYNEHRLATAQAKARIKQHEAAQEQSYLEELREKRERAVRQEAHQEQVRLDMSRLEQEQALRPNSDVVVRISLAAAVGESKHPVPDVVVSILPAPVDNTSYSSDTNNAARPLSIDPDAQSVNFARVSAGNYRGPRGGFISVAENTKRAVTQEGGELYTKLAPRQDKGWGTPRP